MWLATFTNPAENYAGAGITATVPVTYIGIEAEFGAVSTCALYIQSDVMSKYRSETDDANNPVQLNSTVEVRRQPVSESPGYVVWFRGYVIEKPVERHFEEGNFIQVVCWDKTGVLAHTLCPYSGNYQWTMESDHVNTGLINMEATAALGEYTPNETIWPAPGSAANYWIGDANSPTATLNANIGAGATDIVLAAGTGDDFAPSGWIKLSDTIQLDEWAYYPTKWTNPNGGGPGIPRVQLGNTALGYPVVRGQLGTLANAWTAAGPVTNLFNKMAKRIAPGENFVYRGANTLQSPQEYNWVPDLGCFVVSTGGVGFTANYNVYDSDGTLGGAIAYTVQDVIKRLIEAPIADGGAGFTAADEIFSAAVLAINRYEYDPSNKQPYALPCIYDLLRALGIDEEYEFWFDHRDGVIRFDVPTIGVRTWQLDNLQHIENALSIEDVYTGVLTKFSNAVELKLLDPANAHHQAAGMGGGTQPEVIDAVSAGGNQWKEGTGRVAFGAAGSGGLDRCCDGKRDSNLRLYYKHNPGNEIVHSYWWFDSTPGVNPTVHLEKVGLSFNTFRVIGPTPPPFNEWGRTRVNPGKSNYYKVRIDGATNFDNTLPEAGGYDWQKIGWIVEGEAVTDGMATETMYCPGSGGPAIIRKDVNALRIVFEYMPGPKLSGDYYYAYVHNFEAYGSTEQYTMVQLTDNPVLQGDLRYIYAPDSFEKMHGGVNSGIGTPGSPRCKILNVGAAAEGGAIAVARTWLMRHLLLYQERAYEYHGVLDRKPELGDYVQVNEEPGGGYEYEGNVRGYSLTVSAEGAITTLRILDYSPEMIE